MFRVIADFTLYLLSQRSVYKLENCFYVFYEKMISLQLMNIDRMN